MLFENKKLGSSDGEVQLVPHSPFSSDIWDAHCCSLSPVFCSGYKQRKVKNSRVSEYFRVNAATG